MTELLRKAIIEFCEKHRPRFGGLISSADTVINGLSDDLTDEEAQELLDNLQEIDWGEGE